VIEKRTGQIISILGDTLQLMDLETYETLEAPIPEEEELRGALTSGLEVEYWRILGKIKVVRKK
jgi:translation initiation factor 5A